MNPLFWPLRILTLLAFSLCLWVSSNPGTAQSPFVFFILLALAALGIPLTPVIIHHTVRLLINRLHPDSDGCRKFNAAALTTFVTVSFVLIVIGAILILPASILLIFLWPLPAFFLLLHHLTTSPKLKPFRQRIFVEFTVCAAFLLLGLILVFTQYPTKLRFRHSATAFQSALATAPRNLTLPRSIGGFLIRDIQGDGQSGTYFLLQNRLFFRDDNFHGFAHKPSLTQTPFYNNQPDHIYTLTPTGIPDWYLFKETAHDWD